METRANYALIGLFTLAVIVSGFLFVLWFSGGERPGGRVEYKIIFPGSVSGLTVGGWVLFNGVRVGEVTKIDILPQDPSRAYAMVAVDANTPIRTDTKAQLEYTGLTGVASVALIGGASTAPPLASTPKEPGVIYAERSGYQDLISAARTVASQASDFFNKATQLIDENSAALSATIKNAEKFSGALAANPEDIKRIISDFASLSAKLDEAADKFDSVLTNLGSKGVVASAATAFKKAADDFNARTKSITENISRFTSSGLRQYETLAVEGRKTLEEINRAIRSLESNPQQLLFGKSPQIPEYSGSR